MASSFDIGVSLDELTCSVCFELYKEPIAFPCGHSFCRVCVEKYWKTREGDTRCVCPNCHEVFLQKTKLKKNVIIREVGLGVEVRNVEHGGVYINKGVKSGGTESSCELCHGEAAKRCVPCELLCCEQHLKPHQHKGHKLVDPGEKIEEFICIEHGKPIQLYCKDDESLMCLMCMDGQHQDQKVVAVEIAHAEIKFGGGMQSTECRPRYYIWWVCTNSCSDFTRHCIRDRCNPSKLYDQQSYTAYERSKIINLELEGHSVEHIPPPRNA
uniref:Uncharacterized protein n=1 Tax=Eptatretus burgeri TaxID=7764 RepID=A0A8C4X0T3_EPTBU